jgi:hypothetical protein
VEGQQDKKHTKEGKKCGFDGNIAPQTQGHMTHTTNPPRYISWGATSGSGTRLVPSTVTLQQETEGSEHRAELTLMDELDSDNESTPSREELIKWIRDLQVQVRTMLEWNEKWHKEVDELTESAAHKTSEILGCAQMQCERDAQMYQWINALVLDKIFSFKKFIISQRDLDDFTRNSSLGMVIMNMKIEKPD